MSEFFDTFNAALPEMETEFTEDWTFAGSDYPAISIDKLTSGSKVMKGGQLKDVNTIVFVQEGTFLESGVKKGSIIVVRGEEFAVLEIDSDGDASRTLLCGPSQIDVF